MADTPFINGFVLKVGDGADPEVFTAIPKIIGFPPIGQTNPLVDVTNFDSATREYIAGLADGDQVDMSCILMPGNTVQSGLKADVVSKTNRNFQVVVNDGTDTMTFDFAMTPLMWRLGPSFDDKNTIEFQYKISGAITES